MENTFEVGGRAYPLLPVVDMTFREQRELKALSGGITIGGFEDALGDLDPDAWFALLVVSMRRLEPRGRDHVALLEGENLLAIVRRMAESAEAEAEAEGDGERPPAAGGEDDAGN